jgi:hypothetical protein
VTVKFSKDRWIRDAIARHYLLVYKSGEIDRCIRADQQGNLLSEGYQRVRYQTHKKSGRVYFNLTWRGITKSVLVNRVIALRFLPNPNNLPQVNHVDGVKAHNWLTNLEWSSGSDNEKHAHRTGLKTGRGSANSNAKLTAEQVLAIRAAADPDTTLAATYGVSKSTIVNIKARRTWRHI